MNSPLSVWKNLIWIVGLGICLLALLGGFIAAAFGHVEISDGSVALGSEQDGSGVDPNSLGQLYQLAETADGGQAYLDSLSFLVDSSLIGMRDYGLVNSSQVWGSEAGNIFADTIADPQIRYPVDGSPVSASAAVSALKPSTLIISLGMDGINRTDETKFIADYSALISAIRAQSPDTRIVLCSLCSVTGSYSGTDGMDVSMAQTVEGWVQTVARSTGAYYLDVADAVTDTSGTLLLDYAGANAKALNSAGISKVLEYVRCHVLS